MMAEQQAGEEKEFDKVVMEPFMVDKIVVNGIQFNVFFDFTSSCFHIPRDLNFWFRAEMAQEVGEPHADFGATRSA